MKKVAVLADLLRARLVFSERVTPACLVQHLLTFRALRATATLSMNIWITQTARLTPGPWHKAYGTPKTSCFSFTFVFSHAFRNIQKYCYHFKFRRLWEQFKARHGRWREFVFKHLFLSAWSYVEDDWHKHVNVLKCKTKKLHQKALNVLYF